MKLNGPEGRRVQGVLTLLHLRATYFPFKKTTLLLFSNPVSIRFVPNLEDAPGNQKMATVPHYIMLFPHPSFGFSLKNHTIQPAFCLTYLTRPRNCTVLDSA